MKPFLGIDLTENKKNEELNGSCFIVAKPSAAMEQALRASEEKANATVERAKLPPVLRVGQWICGAVAALLGVGLLRGLTEVTVDVAYRNAPALFWVAGISLVLWLILRFLGSRKQKKVMDNEESQQTISNVESVMEGIYREFAVPGNAYETDVLSFFYTVKDGQLKVKEKGMQLAPYFNPVFKMYTDEENLYLVNLEAKYAFPKTALRGLRTENKHIRICGWNKEKSTDNKRYKPFKLTVDQYGCVHAKAVHILEVEHGGETWQIRFPSYELPAVEAITGLKATD